MKTDKEILKLFDKKEDSFNAWFNYEELTKEEKERLFDLVSNREPVIKTGIKEEIHKYIEKHSNKANKKLDSY